MKGSYIKPEITSERLEATALADQPLLSQSGWGHGDNHNHGDGHGNGHGHGHGSNHNGHD